jgi:hypothetical protein
MNTIAIGDLKTNSDILIWNRELTYEELKLIVGDYELIDTFDDFEEMFIKYNINKETQRLINGEMDKMDIK